MADADLEDRSLRPTGRAQHAGRFRSTISLTTRILAVNLIPLVALGGSLFLLDSYRRQLLDERYKLARIEAQITAEALAGATAERQKALLIQIGKEQNMRLRIFDRDGTLTADSFALAPPSFRFNDPAADPWPEDVARWMDATVDFLTGARGSPPYTEPTQPLADAWPEVARARQQGLTQIELRHAPDRTPVITAAAPVGLRGATLLTTRNARDITLTVRSARSQLLLIIAVVLVISFFLSLYLARTIIDPLRRLSRAAVRVRLGRERDVEVPRMGARGDELGVLARAVSDMTAALRLRIDAVETFAADVAHEIKNPLASLRSAVDSLQRVSDPDLRTQLIDIAAHDVRRIDRLVTEIAEASRIDAELSRATFEAIDLATLTEHLVRARQDRQHNRDCRVQVEREGRPAIVLGVPLRLERVLDNLLDNAVSFSPPGGRITVTVAGHDDRVIATICDEGPGIPPERREKVFARFHSVRPEEEGFGDHSGLGLAIARTIAEAHDGSLRVADPNLPEQPGGACLVLDLPAA